MRSILIIAGGLVLFGLCALGVKLLAGDESSTMLTVLKIFLPLWLAAAAFNMWMGVTRAGYSVAEEFPIFLAIFGVPAAVALLVWWKFS
jgi:hypothetical protein